MLQFICLDCESSFTEIDFTTVKTKDSMELELFCPKCGSDEWEEKEINHETSQ